MKKSKLKNGLFKNTRAKKEYEKGYGDGFLAGLKAMRIFVEDVLKKRNQRTQKIETIATQKKPLDKKK